MVNSQAPRARVPNGNVTCACVWSAREPVHCAGPSPSPVPCDRSCECAVRGTRAHSGTQPMATPLTVSLTGTTLARSTQDRHL